MKRIIITIDDELAPLLEGKVNRSEYIRECIRVYNGYITTDNMEQMRQSYKALLKYLETKFESHDERFERYDESFQRLDKLISMLETRM